MTFLPTSVKTSLYADDLAIWASSPSVECATSVVEAALKRLMEWSSKWRLPLNPLKCETSFFSLVSQPIPCFLLHCLCLLGSIKRILMYLI